MTSSSNGAGHSADDGPEGRGTREWAIGKLMNIIDTPIDPTAVTAADQAAAVRLVGKLSTKDWLIAKLTGFISKPFDPTKITPADIVAAVMVLGKMEGWLPQEPEDVSQLHDTSRVSPSKLQS
jgi:hypothetical protein